MTAGLIERVLMEYPNSVAVSAIKQEGLNALTNCLAQHLVKWRQHGYWLIPQSEGTRIAEIYDHGEVVRVEYIDASVKIEGYVPWYLHGKLKQWSLKINELNENNS